MEELTKNLKSPASVTFTVVSSLMLAGFGLIALAWIMTLAKNLGDNRSREKLETGFKITFVAGFIYWLLVAVFVWIK